MLSDLKINFVNGLFLWVYGVERTGLRHISRAEALGYLEATASAKGKGNDRFDQMDMIEQLWIFNASQQE